MTTIRATVAIWTVTTDGDNCPITCTVHGSELEAIGRIVKDLSDSGHPAPSGVPLAVLADWWEQHLDGACIIERHVITGELTTQEVP